MFDITTNLIVVEQDLCISLGMQFMVKNQLSIATGISTKEEAPRGISIANRVFSSFFANVAVFLFVANYYFH